MYLAEWRGSSRSRPSRLFVITPRRRADLFAFCRRLRRLVRRLQIRFVLTIEHNRAALINAQCVPGALLRQATACAVVVAARNHAEDARRRRSRLSDGCCAMDSGMDISLSRLQGQVASGPAIAGSSAVADGGSGVGLARPASLRVGGGAILNQIEYIAGRNTSVSTVPASVPPISV